MTAITPIIMESEILAVTKKIALIQERRESRVHFDIGDGLLTDWYSVAPADLQGQNLAKLAVDFHLLVEDPTEWVEECVALHPARIIGQVERMGSQELFLEAIRGYNKTVGGGLALQITTPIEALTKAALKQADVVLLLAVPAGTAGSKFDQRVVAKIKELRQVYTGSILVDGGMNKVTAKVVSEAGATEIAENSYYWQERYESK